MKRMMTAMTAAALLLSLGSCDHEQKKDHLRRQQRWEKLSVAYEETRKEMLEKYKAELFPPDDYANHTVFSTSLEQLLVHNEKPILLKAVVDDITMDGNDYFLHVTAYFSKYPSYDSRRLVLTVRTNHNDIQPLLSWNGAKSEEGQCGCLSGPLAYLVIRPKGVAKVIDALKREAYGYEATDTSIFEGTADLIALRILPEE